jgi:hypothetical protein
MVSDWTCFFSATPRITESDIAGITQMHICNDPVFNSPCVVVTSLSRLCDRFHLLLAFACLETETSLHMRALLHTWHRYP